MLPIVDPKRALRPTPGKLLLDVLLLLDHFLSIVQIVEKHRLIQKIGYEYVLFEDKRQATEDNREKHKR